MHVGILSPGSLLTLWYRSATVFLAGLFLLSLSQDAAAQPPRRDGASKTVSIVRIETPPVVDGRLDEAVWSRAATIEDLHQIQPNEYAVPSERTQIYLMYGDDALYVGARLWDSNPDGISANILRQREFLSGDDHFAVILDPFNNRRSGYIFIVSPNGVRVDGLYQNPTQSQLDWDGIYDAKATQDERGWVAEMAIPFKTLSFDPKNATWGLNFFRVIARKNERLAWVSRDRSMNPSISGTAVGFTGLKQGLGLDVVPSLNVHRDGSEPSLDVFYKVTPALNAALTINTDFSATEVDDRQVNLTRFNLFFPEKRDFFLRDLDIFEFGGQAGFTGSSPNSAATPASLQNGRPFFSRRLGLSGSGEPVDLHYGGKLSGRIGRWDVGALSARQGRFGNVDAANVFVGRVTANVLSESKVGVIATNGDPTSNRASTLVGADFQYLSTRFRGNRTLQGEAWVQRTDTDGLEGDSSAFGFGVHMPNNTGLRGGATFKELERNFNPALGFVNRRGLRDAMLDLGYTYRWRSGYVRSVFGGVDVERIEGIGGGLETQVIAIRPLEVQTTPGEQLVFRYIDSREVLGRPFEISRGVVIPPGDFSFGQYWLDVGTGPQRRVAGGFTYRAGEFYSGNRLNLGARMTWRPSKHFRSGLNYDINDVTLREGRFITRLVSFRTDVVLSSTLSWVNLVQYDNVSERIGINSRIHWIPQDGREMFVVLNQNFDDIDRDNSFRSGPADLALKVNYTFRW